MGSIPTASTIITQSQASLELAIRYNQGLNQPANPLTGFSAEGLIKISSLDFIWIEQNALTCLLHHQDENDLKQILQKSSHIIYSSDLGQKNQIDISTWLSNT